MRGTHADRGWSVSEHTHTGRFVHVFADEDLAIQFAVSIGSQAEPFFLPF